MITNLEIYKLNELSWNSCKFVSARISCGGLNCDVLTHIWLLYMLMHLNCYLTNKLHSQWLCTFQLNWSELNQQRDLWSAPVLLSVWRAQRRSFAVSTVLQTSQTVKWCNLTAHWSRPVPAWMTQLSSASRYQALITLNRITDQPLIMYPVALPHFAQLCQDSAAARQKSNPRALVFVTAPPPSPPRTKTREQYNTLAGYSPWLPSQWQCQKLGWQTSQHPQLFSCTFSNPLFPRLLPLSWEM